MVKAKTLVGLDVHAAEIVAAVLEVETGECADSGCRVIEAYFAIVSARGLCRRRFDPSPRLNRPRSKSALSCHARQRLDVTCRKWGCLRPTASGRADLREHSFD